MNLLDLLFPAKCVFCGKPIKGDSCDKCADLLPVTEGARSVKRGEFFSLCVSPFAYTGLVRESIKRYKFSGRQSYAAAYAGYCAPLIREKLDGRFDVITWVPVSRKRGRRRGYDQSELLAKAIAKELGMKCEKILDKKRDTPAQSTLTGAARRRANVSGAYTVTGRADGRKILLVDDIITTGATLSECARVLLMAGAEDVVACTAASAEAGRKSRKSV